MSEEKRSHTSTEALICRPLLWFISALVKDNIFNALRHLREERVQLLAR